eukprot:9471291-Pyramimonas_sp.AAC.3
MALSTNLAVCQQRWAAPRNRACADVVRRAVGMVGRRAQGAPLVGSHALSAEAQAPRRRWTLAGPSRAGARGYARHRSRSRRSGSCVANRMGACAPPRPVEGIAKLPATNNPNWSDDKASPSKTLALPRSGSRIGCKRRTPGVQRRRRRGHSSGSTANGLSA